MRRRVIAIAILAVFQAGVSFGVVETQTFQAGEWQGCGLNCLYMVFPVSVSEALSAASVDSVWVTVSGTSHQGYQTLCLGGDCTTVECRDGLLVSFEATSSATMCDPGTTSPDGIVDYVAGAYIPAGDNVPFEVAVPLSGIERTGCCEPAYQVLEPSPSFDGVFSQDQVSLRIWRVHGGPMGTQGSCYKCMNGLAEVESITVHIAYGDELPAESAAWGTVKSFYK